MTEWDLALEPSVSMAKMGRSSSSVRASASEWKWGKRTWRRGKGGGRDVRRVWGRRVETEEGRRRTVWANKERQEEKDEELISDLVGLRDEREGKREMKTYEESCVDDHRAWRRRPRREQVAAC
jgi:hypothetical protein